MRSFIRLFILLFIVLFLGSCATIFNPPTTVLHVYTNGPAKLTYQKDTLLTQKNRISLEVRRQKEDLLFTAFNDSLSGTVVVPSKNSFAYKSNFTNYGLGYLLERNNPKRYTYPDEVYIDLQNKTQLYNRYGNGNHQGEIEMQAAFPMMGFLTFKGVSGQRFDGSVLGVAAGFNFYHSASQFFNVSYQGVVNYKNYFFLPFYYGVHKNNISYTTINLSNNYRNKRFVFGYGLSYGARNLRQTKTLILFYLPFKYETIRLERYHTWGLNFSAGYMLGQSTSVALSYQPTIYNINANRFMYEYNINLSFIHKIRLN